MLCRGCLSLRIGPLIVGVLHVGFDPVHVNLDFSRLYQTLISVMTLCRDTRPYSACSADLESK